MTDSQTPAKPQILSANTSEQLQQQLKQLQTQLKALTNKSTKQEQALVELDIADTLLGLQHNERAWTTARKVVEVFIQHQDWQNAVEALNVLYQADQPASIVALGQAAWLAVTFPVQPETTLAILTHLIDEMPPQSDGAAVAAIVSQYIVDIRATDAAHESLSFLTRNMLVKVAEKHSQVNSQQGLDVWIQKLELNTPDKFLPRLSLVVSAIVEDNWWFDRDKLRELIPD